MYYNKIILVLQLILVLKDIRVDGKIKIDRSQIKEFSEIARSLKLGDSCSWSDEEFRQNFTELTSNIPLNSPFRKSLSQRFIQLTLNDKRKFCDAWDLLVCSKISGTCECGDPGKQIVFPNSDQSSDFLVETDEEEGKEKCRWTENTYCTSPDAAATIGINSNSKCQKGFTCSSTENGNTCTYATILNYVIKRRGSGSPLEIVRRMKKDLFNGKICSCMASKITPLHEFIRKKRSAEIIEEVNDYNAMALVSPILKYF